MMYLKELQPAITKGLSFRISRRRFLGAAGVVGLTLLGGVELELGETVNTEDYFISKHTGVVLTGEPGVGHPLAQTVSKNAITFDKFEREFQRSEYFIRKDDGFYLVVDMADPPYRFSNGLWFPKEARTGERISVKNKLTWVNTGNEQNFNYVRTPVERIIENYDLGKELIANSYDTQKARRVIVSKYEFRDGKGEVVFERHYYSGEWGLVRWEYYEKGKIARMTKFNKILKVIPSSNFSETISPR